MSPIEDDINNWNMFEDTEPELEEEFMHETDIGYTDRLPDFD